MTNLELYVKQGHTDGSETNTFRYKPDADDAIPSGGAGAVIGMMGMMGSLMVGCDFGTASLIAATAGTAASTGVYKTVMYSGIQSSLRKLSNGTIDQPKLNQTRRTWKEKRALITENVLSDDRKSKVTRELVTNRHGIWIEEKLVPIATTAVQVKSWDTVLDSIIKVHGLEKLDMIASNTIPGLSTDGKKLSWRKTAGNILGELGVLQECTNRNCSTECRHIF